MAVPLERKWYDAFQSDDALVSGLLKKFDAPHKRIHCLGAGVRAQVASGNLHGAQALIDKSRETTLAEMIRLFAALRTLISEQQREMLLVLDANGKEFGAAVDAIVSVEKLPSAGITPPPAGLSVDTGGMVSAVAQRANSGGLVLILDAARLAGRAHLG